MTETSEAQVSPTEQIFARIPKELHAEIEALADRHFRSTKGEICAAMEYFVGVPAERLDREWRYEKGMASDIMPVNPAVPNRLAAQFRAAASRCGSLNVGISHAIEIWLLKHKLA